MSKSNIQIDEAKIAAEAWLKQNGSKRKATINDVAQLSGVSKKTISRVINQSPLVKDNTRELVNAVIKALDYVPNAQAQGLAFRHSFLVGLIYDNPNPQYVAKLQQGVLDCLRPTPYELVIHPCNREDPGFAHEAVNFIQRQRLTGVILAASSAKDDQLAQALIDANCKYIRINSFSLQSNNEDTVSSDRIGATQAARYLCQQNHKRIAFITGKEGFFSSIERQRGFEEGLAEYQQELDTKYLISGDYTFESGVSAAQKLLARPTRPTAIFASNDEMATGVLQALKMQNVKVPEDISVIGYDDFDISRQVWPRLTTVHAPTRDVAKLAAQKLLGMDNDEPVNSEEVLPWLVIRESSGPAATD